MFSSVFQTFKSYVDNADEDENDVSMNFNMSQFCVAFLFIDYHRFHSFVCLFPCITVMQPQNLLTKVC